MDNQLHEVVQLLLARMKSHPEEFTSDANRWGWMVEEAQRYCSDEENDAINAGLRHIRLQEIHELVLDELCNGEERRRKSNEVLRIDEFGNMGIGTVSPSTKLHVSTTKKALGI